MDSEIVPELIIKPKKQLSQLQLDHLEKIRVRALEVKKEMKVITEKSNKMKELEDVKLMKQLQKQHQAEKYDQHLLTMKQEAAVNEEPSGPTEEESIPEPIVKKKKVIKKIIYEKSSSDDDDEETEIIVKRVKKPVITPPIAVPTVLPPPPPKTYSDLVYESSLDKIKQRMMDDRCKHLLNSVLPQYN